MANVRFVEMLSLNPVTKRLFISSYQRSQMALNINIPRRRPLYSKNQLAARQVNNQLSN